MIDNIELTNWKTHKSTKLSFQKGVNVLIGIMGAGKSSTTDAISYALFGNFPALNSGRVNTEGLISNRRTREEQAEIKLGFSSGGSDYVVTRTVGKKGSTARLEKNGAYLQSQPRKVTEEIEGVLKIDYDTFSRAVYAEQNRLEYFLELREGERKKQIDRMLGLDAFAIAEGNTTSLINAIKSEIKYEDEALSGIDIKSISSQLAGLKGEAKVISETQSGLSRRQKELKKESEEAKARLESLKRDMQRKKDMEQEVVKLGSRISTLREEIRKINVAVAEDEPALLKRSDEMARTDKALAAKLQEARDEERKTNRRLADLEAEIKQCQAKIADRDRILKELKGGAEERAKKDLDEENHSLQELMAAIAARTGKLNEASDAMKELSKHISKCPICDRELDEVLKAKLLREKKQARDAAFIEISKLDEATREKGTQIKRLAEAYNNLVLSNKKLAEYKGADAALDHAITLKSEVGEALYKLTLGIREMEKELEALRDEQGRLKIKLQSSERRKAYEREIRQDTEAAEKKRKEAEGIAADDKAIDKLQEERGRQMAELGNLDSKVESNERYLASLSRQVAEKEKQAKDYAAMEARVESRRRQLMNLNKFKSALVDTEATLRTKIVSSINGIMQSLWTRLYPYGDYGSLRLNATKDDYMLEFNLPAALAAGGWVPVDQVGSGGERSVAALAMRIALAMVIVPNLKWLILDEPTHNIDATGISKLIDVLGGTLPQIVDQIFIITHDEDLKQISSAKIYQFDRDKAADGPTTVSQI